MQLLVLVLCVLLLVGEQPCSGTRLRSGKQRLIDVLSEKTAGAEEDECRGVVRSLATACPEYSSRQTLQFAKLLGPQCAFGDADLCAASDNDADAPGKHVATVRTPQSQVYCANFAYPGLKEVAENVFVVDDFLNAAEVAQTLEHRAEASRAAVSFVEEDMEDEPAVHMEEDHVDDYATWKGNAQCAAAVAFARKMHPFCATAYRRRRTSQKDMKAGLPEVLTSRLEALSNVSRVHFSPAQVTTYGVGDYYRPHVDSLLERGRFITIVTYLNDDFVGGATHFPMVAGRVMPKKGRAVMFFSTVFDWHTTQGRWKLNVNSLHEAEDVKSGSEKIIVNQFIHPSEAELDRCMEYKKQLNPKFKFNAPPTRNSYALR